MARERSSASLHQPVVLLLALVLTVLSPAPARAQSAGGWKLCNETSYILEAATGRPDGAAVVVEGWTRLRPGECRIALPAPLRPGAHFLFARSSTSHRGGQRVWGGEIPLCVDIAGSFSVESPPSCSAMGLDSRSFRAIKIDSKTTWTTRLLETEPFGLRRAEFAGLQRILADAGVDDTDVDGYIGRRSRAAIARFLSANKLSPKTSDAELIDILEEIARNRGREVGMTLCNRTDKRVWAAVGRRRGDGWESRGWWGVDPGACTRTIDDSLIATPHFVYAEMETPDGVRRLEGANEIFCIAHSKFAVIGREGCEVRAYREADFVETETPSDGKLVFEFFDRDFGEAEDNG